MDTIIKQTLAKMGLNTKEISIYLTLLQIGTAPASTLGTRTNITRSTAQYTCKQLAKKGLIRMTERANSYIYTAESPETIFTLLDRRRLELKKKDDKAQEIVGELKDMMNPNISLPKVQFYEGTEEMIHLYERILDLQMQIDSFEEAGELFDLFEDYSKEFVKKRVEKKIYNRCIAPKGNPYNITDPKKYIGTRYVDSKAFPFSWHLKICGNLVGIFSFQRHSSVAIGIEHEDIAKNFKLLFELVWQNCNTKQK